MAGTTNALRYDQSRRVASYGLTLHDIVAAIEANNASAGGGYTIHHGEQRFIRGQAILTGPDDIESIVIRRELDGTPLLIRDLAEVTVSALARQGVVTRDGRGEAVTGLVMMLVGENSRRLSKASSNASKKSRRHFRAEYAWRSFTIEQH